MVSLDSHQLQGYFGFGVGSEPPGESELSRLLHAREGSPLEQSLNGSRYGLYNIASFVARDAVRLNTG